PPDARSGGNFPHAQPGAAEGAWLGRPRIEQDRFARRAQRLGGENVALAVRRPQRLADGTVQGLLELCALVERAEICPLDPRLLSARRLARRRTGADQSAFR